MLLCQAAPNPLMSMMAGWELELLTVLYSLNLAETVMSWGFLLAFVPHSKILKVSSTSQFPSQFPLIQVCLAGSHEDH